MSFDPFNHDRSGHVYVGAEVVPTYNVFDEDGNAESPNSVVLTVLLPNGTTTQPTVTNTEPGVYEASYTPALVGRYVFVWLSTNPATSRGATLDVVSATSALVTLAAVKTYLGVTSATDAEITEALAAETAAQGRRCRVGPSYPADLAEALKRRVARNLALRGIPLAVLQGDAEFGGTVLPGNDPEVRRLEGPHRKVVTG